MWFKIHETERRLFYESMKIYISGKISGLEKEEYEMNFKLAYSKLFEFGLVDWSGDVINPLDLKPFLGIKIWLCYMITDLYHLRKCTHLAVQKNWIDSKGAMIEVFAAKFIFKLKVIWL